MDNLKVLNKSANLNDRNQKAAYPSGQRGEKYYGKGEYHNETIKAAEEDQETADDHLLYYHKTLTRVYQGFDFKDFV